MATRKLVEISPAKHQNFTELQARIKKMGERVPTVPDLVNKCIDHGWPFLLGDYAATPKTPGKRS